MSSSVLPIVAPSEDNLKLKNTNNQKHGAQKLPVHQRRKTFFEKNYPVVLPVQYTLDSGHTAVYIPILEMLQKLCRHTDILDKVQETKMSQAVSSPRLLTPLKMQQKKKQKEEKEEEEEEEKQKQKQQKQPHLLTIKQLKLYGHTAHVGYQHRRGKGPATLAQARSGDPDKNSITAMRM
ncbi:uncharacterized protein V6R79_008943 [Siganus canaliculatus]